MGWDRLGARLLLPLISRRSRPPPWPPLSLRHGRAAPVVGLRLLPASHPRVRPLVGAATVVEATVVRRPMRRAPSRSGRLPGHEAIPDEEALSPQRLVILVLQGIHHL